MAIREHTALHTSGSNPFEGFHRDIRTQCLIVAGLSAVFFTIYYQLGRAFTEMPGYYDYGDIFFGLDHLEAIRGWVKYHKGTHPLILLIAIPAGWLLKLVFGSYETGMAVFGAAAGGASVASVYLALRLLSGRTAAALPASVFFGVSMSQLIMGPLADTYTLVTISLIPTYVLTLWCLRKKRVRFPLWAAAGILSFAVTITSTIQTGLCLGVVHAAAEGKKGLIKRLAAFSAVVLAAGLSLSLVQKQIIPDAELFFMPAVYEREMRFTSKIALESPGLAAREIGKNFVFYAFIGDEPRATTFKPGRLSIVYFQSPLSYRVIGGCAAALWIALFLFGLRLGVRRPDSRLFIAAAALSLAANAGIHAVYSMDELFLYTPHFAFLMLFLCLNKDSAQTRWVPAAWWLLAGLTAANNLWVVRDFLDKYAS